MQFSFDIIDQLVGRGWIAAKRQEPEKFPQEILERYPWLPEDVTMFLSSFDSIVSPSDKAWFITSSELLGKSDSAFVWNQWEQDSLSAATLELDWQKSIRLFWDEHFPFILSVKTGYAYFAIQRDTTIVAGEEPEFEETETIADNFLSFLALLLTDENSLSRRI